MPGRAERRTTRDEVADRPDHERAGLARAPSDASAAPAAGARPTLAIRDSSGIIGIGVNTLVLWLLTEFTSIDLGVAAILASLVSTFNNFVLTELFVFRHRESRHNLVVRYLAFSAINFATLLIRIPVLLVLTNVLGVYYLISNLIAIGITFLIRYLVSDSWIWAGRDHSEQTPVDGWYHYDIHGLAKIRSCTNLPELDAFNVTTPVEADIIVERRWMRRVRASARR